LIFDETDKRILLQLKENSRLSMRELAKKVNLSPPSVAERVRRLENEGVIKGFTIDIDFSRLGYEIDCFMEVTLRQGEYEKFKQKIAENPHAEFCYRIAGHACYIVKLRFKNLSDIESFINEITPFAGTVTHIALSEIKIKRNLLEN
jgi:Lrp/AsnC family transcriptional regulator, leucine-responsive regulatory protein